MMPVANIDRDQVAQLVARFGPKVRNMYTWNRTIDGSAGVPTANMISGLLDSHLLKQLARG